MYSLIKCTSLYCFFFSSRRRHTRWPRDWSSDVCSSDLRDLIPGAIPGHSVEDVVIARADYSKLEVSDSPIRLRLNSAVVAARNLGNPTNTQEVEVTYARGKDLFKVRDRKSTRLNSSHVAI